MAPIKEVLALLLAFCLSVEASKYWSPKLLGSFYLKDAGFVEAFENPSAQSDSDKFTLYFTTFNFGEWSSRSFDRLLTCRVAEFFRYSMKL